MFFKIDITQAKELKEVFDTYKPSRVVNLAAQAGVRYSLVNPHSYYNSNLIGFGNILENCIEHRIKHFVYASSSSVYGGNIKLPLSEKDSVDRGAEDAIQRASTKPKLKNVCMDCGKNNPKFCMPNGV